MDFFLKLGLLFVIVLSVVWLAAYFLMVSYRRNKFVRQINQIRRQYVAATFAWEGVKPAHDALLELLEANGESVEHLDLMELATRKSKTVANLVSDYQRLSQRSSFWSLLVTSEASLHALLGDYQEFAKSLIDIHSWVSQVEDQYKRSSNLVNGFTQAMQNVRWQLDQLDQNLKRARVSIPSLPQVPLDRFHIELAEIESLARKNPLRAARRLEDIAEEIALRPTIVEALVLFFKTHDRLHYDFDQSVTPLGFSSLWLGIDNLRETLTKLSGEARLSEIAALASQIEAAARRFRSCLVQIITALGEIDQARTTIAAQIEAGYSEPLEYAEANQRADRLLQAAVSYLASLQFQRATNEAQAASLVLSRFTVEMRTKKDIWSQCQVSLASAKEMAGEVCERLARYRSWLATSSLPDSEVEVATRALDQIGGRLTKLFDMSTDGQVLSGRLVDRASRAQASLQALEVFRSAQVSLAVMQLDLDEFEERVKRVEGLVSTLSDTIARLDLLRLKLAKTIPQDSDEYRKLGYAYNRIFDARRAFQEGRLVDAYYEVGDVREKLLSILLTIDGTLCDIIDVHAQISQKASGMARLIADLRYSCLTKVKVANLKRMPLLRQAASITHKALQMPAIENLEVMPLLHALEAQLRLLEEAEVAIQRVRDQLNVDESEYLSQVQHAATTFRNADYQLHLLSQFGADADWPGYPQWVAAEAGVSSSIGDGVSESVLRWSIDRNSQVQHLAQLAMQRMTLHKEDHDREEAKAKDNQRRQTQAAQAKLRSQLQLAIYRFFQVRDAGTGFISPTPTTPTLTFSSQLVFALPEGWQTTDYVEVMENLYE